LSRQWTAKLAQVPESRQRNPPVQQRARLLNGRRCPRTDGYAGVTARQLQDETAEIVNRAAHFLPQVPNAEGRRLTRLDLANWLVSPENPLTARAVMNGSGNILGVGISAVVDDLGVQGEWPVQPELLDWLACGS